MTVLEAIRKSSDFLARKGVDSPRLQAELLLAHVLNLPRMKLYVGFDRSLIPSEIDSMRELVKRRGHREPLQHILGATSFCGLELVTNRHVLVPRPETEILAELGWQFLVSRGDRAVALDFGTGSGCIAIGLAVKCPNARVLALEASPDALAVARQNAARHGVEQRIEFIEGDGFGFMPAQCAFDLIISNPPYVPRFEIQSLQPEVRDYDPRLALDGGPEGLDFYETLASKAGPFLRLDGRIMLELGDNQAAAVVKIFEAQKWIVEAVKEDYAQRQRFLIARLGGGLQPE